MLSHVDQCYVLSQHGLKLIDPFTHFAIKYTPASITYSSTSTPLYFLIPYTSISLFLYEVYLYFDNVYTYLYNVDLYLYNVYLYTYTFIPYTSISLFPNSPIPALGKNFHLLRLILCLMR